MLIGDKGESGGRRWGGVRICPWGIFGQSQGQSLGRCPDLPLWHFRAVPRSVAGQVSGFPNLGFSDSLKVRRWDTLILPQGHFAGSPRVSRWVEIFAPRPFFSSPKVRRWEVVGFPDSGFSTSPSVRRWEVSGFPDSGFSYSPKVRRWVLHSPDSGFCSRPSLGAS